MKDKKINLGKNLIYLRRKNRLSIEQVAGEIGVSRQAVSKWETGETLPDHHRGHPALLPELGSVRLSEIPVCI